VWLCLATTLPKPRFPKDGAVHFHTWEAVPREACPGCEDSDSSLSSSPAARTPGSARLLPGPPWAGALRDRVQEARDAALGAGYQQATSPGLGPHSPLRQPLSTGITSASPNSASSTLPRLLGRLVQQVLLAGRRHSPMGRHLLLATILGCPHNPLWVISRILNTLNLNPAVPAALGFYRNFPESPDPVTTP
jgi:hypothetical protein